MIEIEEHTFFWFAGDFCRGTSEDMNDYHYMCERAGEEISTALGALEEK